jgi:hypothetical protein
MANIGAKMAKMANIGAKMANMANIGAKLANMANIGTKLANMANIWARASDPPCTLESSYEGSPDARSTYNLAKESLGRILNFFRRFVRER